MSETQGSPVSTAARAVIPGPSAGPVSEKRAATEVEPTAGRENSATAVGMTAVSTRPGLPLARFEQQLAAAGISERTWVCPTCEHILRVSGGGRHRVYFELTDGLLDDPVMDRACPGCAHDLPGKNVHYP